MCESMPMSQDRSAHRWRSVGVLLLAGLVVLLAAACSKGASPAPVASGLPTPGGHSVSSSPSETPSVAPSPAGIPADVPTIVNNSKNFDEKPPLPPEPGYGADDIGSAINFAKFFIETIDWAGATTNPSYMKHYYQPSCKQCQTVADAVTQAQVNHYRNLGGRITVREGEAMPNAVDPGAVDSISVVTSVDSLEQLDRRGNLVHAAPAQPHAVVVVSLAWTSAKQWTVIGLSAA
jgi:hypothetical protein